VPDLQPTPATVTVDGVRGEVLAYIAEQLQHLDELAERTGTPRPSTERMPLERLEHLEGLMRTIRAGVVADPNGIPSPHFLRALGAQVCTWLEELRGREAVSWRR
jgi:hypothetical protein